MDPRPFRIASIVEWVVAAAGVLLLVWAISVPAQRVLGPGVEASRTDVVPTLPAGVPAGATNVPVMLLRDGREIRHGDLRSRVDQLLPEQLADGPAQTSQAEFGPRHARAYAVDGSRFVIVCERLEPSGPMRVAGIYLK